MDKSFILTLDTEKIQVALCSHGLGKQGFANSRRAMPENKVWKLLGEIIAASLNELDKQAFQGQTKPKPKMFYTLAQRRSIPQFKSKWNMNI